jgi:uncharacterized membrane protein YphA (DoxX/SURF4 family)
MGRLAALGRLFFATSLIAFGVQQFIYGDFVPGRAPVWPASIPGRLIWAYLSGAVFSAAGAAIILGIKARWAAVVSGTMIFVWALLRHIPLAVADPNYGGAWTMLGKALALFGGAFAVAGSLPKETGGRAGALAAIVNSKDGFIYLGRVCLGAFLISSGIQHFLFSEFVAQLVPTWIPGAVFWTYFAAVALIAGGAGLILPLTTRWAGTLTGLMIFLWVVLLHIPRALAAADAGRRNEWTAVFEALAMSGIAFVLAGTASTVGRRSVEHAPEPLFASKAR